MTERNAPRSSPAPYVFSMIGVAITTAAILLIFRPRTTVGYLTVAAIAASMASYSYFFVRLVNRNPESMNVSILGYPRCGKTVYLTVLFDLLQRGRSGRVQFTPYGVETHEMVESYLSLMAKGKWPPATVPGTVVTYSAKASLPGALSRRRYKLSINDAAGESVEEMNPTTDRWLHRSDYFKLVVDSDAILLGFDCELLVRSDQRAVEDAQNGLVAAFQVLAEAKGATEETRLRAPVALLFLKSDVLPPDTGLDLVTQAVPRLVNVCMRRCRRFEAFLVSSTGPVAKDGYPPAHLNPTNVAEPVEWLFEALR